MTQKEYAVIVKIWYDPEDYTSDIDPIDFIEETLEQLSHDACKSGYDLNFEILKNEAIDQAFRELSETIQNHTKRLHDIEKVLEDANLWSFEK